jgi:hypothetical protein
MRVHSRVIRRPPFGTKVPTSARVPPLPFHPAPTVSSAHGPAGLLHPATGHGVRHISSTLPPRRPKTPLRLLPPMSENLGFARTFPNGAYTLRSFSLRDSRSASPRPLPSRCLRPPSAPLPAVQARLSGEVPAFAQPQGFAPSRSPLQRPTLPSDPARCSLGLSVHRKWLMVPRRPGPEGPVRRCRSPAARRLSSCGAGTTPCCPAALPPEGRCTADPLSAHALRRVRALPAIRPCLLRFARRRREAGSRLRASPRARSAPEGTRAAQFAARCAASRRRTAGKEPTSNSVSNLRPQFDRRTRRSAQGKP